MTSWESLTVSQVADGPTGDLFVLEPLVPAVVSFVSDTVGRTQDNCDTVASYTVGKPSGLGQQIMSQKQKVESKVL